MRTSDPGAKSAGLKSHNADLILTNAEVVSMAGGAAATTIVVQAGVIRVVGDDSLVSDYRDSATEMIDCAGRSVTPGLIDAHSHPILGVERAIGLDLGQVTDGNELLSRLRNEADRLIAANTNVQGDLWLRAWNLDYAAFEDLRLAASTIDAALRSLPALLLFFDGHTALASRRALFLAGIDGSVAFADNSRVMVDSAGSPTGELREESAIELVLRIVPALSAADTETQTRGILGHMSSVGLTGLCVMDGNANTFEVIHSLDGSASGLPLRIVTAFDHHPGDGDELIAQRIGRFGAAGGRRWRGGLVKLYADGVIDTGTGWLYEPDARGDGTSGLWGDPENLFRTMQKYSRGGLQIATHAIGDQAVGATIDAYLECGVMSARGAPHRIEHIECLTDLDLERLAAAQITASIQPSHLQWRKGDGSDEWASRLGSGRTSHAWRAGDLFAAGVPVAFGSDWPVAQYDPRIGMAWARLRRTPGDPSAPIFEPEQRVDAIQALHGFTVGAARAQGDRDLGRIAPGYRADFALWDSNPLMVSADELLTTPILATFVGGQPTFIEKAGS